jgi:ABC-type lipoprotein release transport system permease subunit
MLVVRMAWRNLWRRARRTLLTVCTVSLGLALLLLSLGLGDGSHLQMINSAVRMGSGHIVIQAEGYQERGEIDSALAAAEIESITRWVERERREGTIQDSVPRVFASGLASSADGSAGVQIIGVEPDIEARISLFAEKIVEGSFLEGTENGRVVIGAGVADKLEIGLGGRVVLMVQGANSDEISSKLVRVHGVMKLGLEEVDQAVILMNLEDAQDFLSLDGQVHQVALLVGNVDSVDSLVTKARAALPGVEALSWSEALPELRDAILVDDGGNYVFHVFIFLLIAFTVMNTLLMSVLERTREFALLDAVGLTPRKRFLMVFVEACFISVLSIGLGFLLGFSGHLYLSEYGLPLDAFYSGDMEAAGVVIDPILYSSLSLRRVLGSVAVVMLLTLTLALLPAVRAARGGDIRLLASH